MKGIPLGIDNFVTLITEDYYFFDKSEYIRTLETQRNFIFFVRPRRMGKSLFSSMAMTYYDVNCKSRFQELFGSLEIGKNPTDKANSFLVLKFDFSHVTCDLDDLEAKFTRYCFNCLKLFFGRYPDLFSEKEIADVLSAASIKEAIVYMVDLIHLKGEKIYLFIDEYDNFANMVLTARGVKAHEEITHGNGFYRDFFKGCKGTFDRILMTGVSPATYDDLTSGFSIADVVSLNPRFNQAIGITEAELRQMIEYYREQGKIHRSTQEIIEEMRPWYDNYCFSLRSYDKEHTIYNTSMVLRYINSLILTGYPPEVMVDRSARTEPKALNYLVMAEDLRNREERIGIVKEICANGFTIGEVEPEFPACDAGDEKNFKSMLFYYGTLTFGGRDELGFPKLIVPNKTMGDLYLTYMLQVAQQEGFYLNGRRKELDAAIKLAAVDGQWGPMAEDIGKLVSEYSSLRNSNKGEESVQAFIRGLLCTSPFFDVWPEAELNMGYSDILLVPKTTENCPTRHSYIIELKYMKSREKNKDKYISDACAQLSQYIQDIHLRDSFILRNTPLTPLYLIFRNHKLIDKGISQ